MTSRFVAFKNADSVDVYLRTDHAHGRIEYELVATIVTAEELPAPRGLWSHLGSALLHIALSVLG